MTAKLRLQIQFDGYQQFSGNPNLCQKNQYGQKWSFATALDILLTCLTGILIAPLALSAEPTSEKPPLPPLQQPLNSHGAHFSADLIFWTAKEVGADCWSEVIFQNSTSSSNDLRSVHFGWDPGFRVGMGYEMMHDRWDTQLGYTWFYTQGSDAVKSAPGSVYSTFMGNFYLDNPTGTGISSVSYEQASIDWAIRFNMFDWELGRKFWVSKALALRPFLGLKGGWIHQQIVSTWENPTVSSGHPLFDVGTESIKNNFWGIGPQAGLNTTWNLVEATSHFFNLFGDFSGALMWGHWSFGDLYRNDIDQKVAIRLADVNSAAFMLRAFMGFEWDLRFCTDRYQLSTKLGYEMQFWLDQLQFYSFTGGRLNDELTLQGGTLEFSFEF